MIDSTIHQRAALYLRVSTARQAEHDVSIPDQKRQGEAYCTSRGIQFASERARVELVLDRLMEALAMPLVCGLRQAERLSSARDTAGESGLTFRSTCDASAK
jgi:DNA invertase Pin-like site-specific DNA recombinase